MNEETTEPESIGIDSLIGDLAGGSLDRYCQDQCDKSLALLQMLIEDLGSVRSDAPICKVMADARADFATLSGDDLRDCSIACIAVFELGTCIAKIGLSKVQGRKRELLDLMSEKFWNAHHVLLIGGLLAERGLCVEFGAEAKGHSADLSVADVWVECKVRSSSAQPTVAKEVVKKSIQSLMDKAKPQIQAYKKEPVAVAFDLDEFRYIAGDQAEQLKTLLVEEMSSQLGRFPNVVGGLLVWHRIAVDQIASQAEFSMPLLVLAFSRGTGPNSLQARWKGAFNHWVVYPD